MDQIEDLAQLHRIAAGDAVALAHFYDQYSRLVYSIAFQIVGEVHLAEEIVQDVFIQVWKKAETYDPSQGKVITWVTSITRHRAIDNYRRLNVRPEGHSIAWDDCCSEKPDGDAEVEPGLIGSEQRQIMLQALSGLPDDQRDAIALAYFKGMTQQEIAAHLNEPLGTVKTRIRLGMQKLRTALSTHISPTE
jgi:RNA polymerase sigma-70 factor, ECF subfamily